MLSSEQRHRGSVLFSIVLGGGKLCFRVGARELQITASVYEAQQELPPWDALDVPVIESTPPVSLYVSKLCLLHSYQEIALKMRDR